MSLVDDPVPAGVTRRLGLGRHLPMIVQTEATECGLASLAMIAVYHGIDTDLPTLRLRFALSRKGTNFESMVRIAAALGLDNRPLRLEMAHLPQLRLPCVLHWDMKSLRGPEVGVGAAHRHPRPGGGHPQLHARGVRAALHRHRDGAVCPRPTSSRGARSSSSRCAA